MRPQTPTALPSSWTARSLWLAVALVAGLQTLVLAWMVYARATLLATGREIVLEVVPVDPRDLFRGEYVTLGYRFTDGPDMTLPVGVRTGDTVYAALTQSGPQDGWKIQKVSMRYPENVSAGAVVLKAHVDAIYGTPQQAEAPRGRLRFGIESYFVPEGQGRVLEEKVRAGRIDAVVSVGRDGEAALKALVIDGERLVEEPLL